MRISTNFVLTLAALLLAMALTATPTWAQSGPFNQNCPVEPTQNVSIANGETYNGSNCVLNMISDVDSFVFTASANDTWVMNVGLAGASFTSNVCLSLFAPGVPPSGGQQIGGTECSNAPYYNYSAGMQQTLTSAGTYTIVVQETGDGMQEYALSLYRLNPLPSFAIPVLLQQTAAGTVSWPTSTDAYTFSGATTGEYQVVLQLAANQTSNVCMSIYQPSATSNAFSGCTNAPYYNYSVTADITPATDGEYLMLIYTAGGDGTVGFTLNVSCLLGDCPPTTSPCLLTDSPNYDSSTGKLTLNFTVGTPVPVTWNGYLVQRDKSQSIFSVSQPITEPPVNITQTKASVPVSGEIGILSTFVTKKQGITCSSFVTINTGTP